MGTPIQLRMVLSLPRPYVRLDTKKCRYHSIFVTTQQSCPNAPTVGHPFEAKVVDSRSKRAGKTKKVAPAE